MPTTRRGWPVLSPISLPLAGVAVRGYHRLLSLSTRRTRHVGAGSHRGVAGEACDARTRDRGGGASPPAEPGRDHRSETPEAPHQGRDFSAGAALTATAARAKKPGEAILPGFFVV